MACSVPYFKVRAGTVWVRQAIWWITKDPAERRDITNRTITANLTRMGVTLPMTVTKTDAANGEWEFGPPDLAGAPAAAGMWRLVIDWTEDGRSDRSACEVLVEEAV